VRRDGQVLRVRCQRIVDEGEVWCIVRQIPGQLKVGDQ
jgi:hypothetical protein